MDEKSKGFAGNPADGDDEAAAPRRPACRCCVDDASDLELVFSSWEAMRPAAAGRRKSKKEEGIDYGSDYRHKEAGKAIPRRA